MIYKLIILKNLATVAAFSTERDLCLALDKKAIIWIKYFRKWICINI